MVQNRVEFVSRATYTVQQEVQDQDQRMVRLR